MFDRFDYYFTRVGVVLLMAACTLAALAIIFTLGAALIASIIA